MLELETINTGITAIKFVSDVLKFKKENLDSKDTEKIDIALDQLDNTKSLVYDLRDELNRIQSENIVYKNTIAKSKDWNEKLEKYNHLVTEGGAIVLQMIDNEAIYACPSCVNVERIELLQTSNSHNYECPNCKTSFLIKDWPKRSSTPRRNTLSSRSRRN